MMMIKGSVLISKITNTLSDPLEIRKSLHVFLAVLALIYVGQWLVKFVRELKTLPPGPWGIPVLGFLPFMRREKHNCFIDLAKKYGTVFSTRMGNQLTVVISDYKLIRENFRKQEYSDRPNTPFMNVLGGYGTYQTQYAFAWIINWQSGKQCVTPCLSPSPLWNL